MKILTLIFCITCFGLASPLTNSQWVERQSGTKAHFRSCQMVSANVGYVVGDSGIILKTTNGGVNWVRQQSGTTYNLLGVDFINENTGTVVTFEGAVRRTTNGGVNWTGQTSPCEGFSVDFVNENTGMISGTGGSVCKTTNGGGYWFLVRNSGGADLNDICMIDSNVAYAAGDPPSWGSMSDIWKTTNGGANWTYQYSILRIDIESISFLNAQTGIVGAWRGNMSKTTNGGTLWIDLWWNQVVIDIHSIQYISDSILTLSGNRFIYRSTNGGNNWYIQHIHPRLAIYSEISFINENTGLCAGFYGAIYTTTNGGDPLGVESIGTGIPDEFKLHQNYPNPFNSETIIEFDLTSAGRYKLLVFDLLGREVMELFDEYRRPGYYRASLSANSLPSGVYFYKLCSEKFKQSSKFVITK